MGYDLTVKHPKPGAMRYYRAGIEFMTFLRLAMIAAGVPQALVFKKFVSNDDWFVTARQSEMISERIVTWLRGRNLTLTRADSNARARTSLDGFLSLLEMLNTPDAKRVNRLLRARAVTIRLDRKDRKALREFAAFCAGSGGFYVD
jgi:hypothetical protein